MLDNLYFKLLALAPPESAFLAVTGRSVNVRALVSKIAYRACAFIMAAAVIYGCWSLYEGFTLPLRKRDWCRSSEAHLCAA